MKELTVLHTSDWHLGHQLYRRKRIDEFEAFLDWLIGVIRENSVDVVVIAGDIFDTALPGSASQKLYYGFLARVGQAGARHIVITAGNHDSPALLEVAGELLRHLNIHIIGMASEDPHKETIVLSDKDGNPELIVCAAPYLRSRDVCRPEPGEEIESRERKLLAGIRKHYAEIAAHAQACREEGGHNVPILATGHLFAAGGQAGDGVRDLYIGSLGQVPADIFPDIFDYIALGHLHRPQLVGGRSTCRYSGSPLAMSFDEANQQKSVCLVKFSERDPVVETLAVPAFRNLISIRGGRDEILDKLRQMVARNAQPSDVDGWIEITHDGSDHAGDLYNDAVDIIRNEPFDILCVRIPRQDAPESQAFAERELEDFSPEEMFSLVMDKNKVGEEERNELIGAFSELLELRSNTVAEAGEQI